MQACTCKDQYHNNSVFHVLKDIARQRLRHVNNHVLPSGDRIPDPAHCHTAVNLIKIEEEVILRVVWKFALGKSGEQFAMTLGTPGMPKWSAVSLATILLELLL